MLKNNILNIFSYLRKIFTKSSKYEYQRFFFERNNKIKRLCISLGFLFSSSQWTNKVSNSVVENLIEDKVDSEFLILKYKYLSTIQYDRYVKIFYKTTFSNKNTYFKYVRLIKYLIILLFSLILLTLVYYILMLITSASNIAILYNKTIFYILSYFINPLSDLIKVLFFFIPLYLYIYILNYFNNTAIFQTNKKTSFKTYSTDIQYSVLNQSSLNINYLFFLKKLLLLVNSLNTGISPLNNNTNSSIEPTKTPLISLFQKSCNFNENTYYITQTHYSWLTLLNNLYLNYSNQIHLKYDLNNYSMLILNDIQNNSNFKNDRWLYKLSLLTPKVTSFFHKIAEQKNLIVSSNLNELPFSSNLWIKNIKNINSNDNFYFNYLTNGLDNTQSKNTNTLGLLTKSMIESKQNLSYLEDSLQFLYKRFYTFNSIDSNIYTKNFDKNINITSYNSNLNLSSLDYYDFLSSIEEVSINNNTYSSIITNNSNFTLDSKFIYYTLLFDTIFNYNIYFTSTCLINSTNFWLGSEPVYKDTEFKFNF